MNKFSKIEIHGKVYEVKDKYANDEIESVKNDINSIDEELVHIHSLIDNIPGWEIEVDDETIYFGKED